MISAIAAVVIAVYEARITREHQKASVWPSLSQYNTGVGGRYTREVENRGLGPAMVRSFEVRVDGAVQRSWSDVVEKLTGESKSDYVYSSFGRGTVLLPGRSMRLVDIPWEPLGQRVHREVNQDRLVTRICYCSVYGDCWLDDSGADEPEPVSACSAQPEDQFAR